ncbi:MAG: hypothetical protein KJO40_08200 [Deltaproteobacteria bacterium]|nr:hypothetical protein [Deltaproteobacteria bacterium]
MFRIVMLAVVLLATTSCRTKFQPQSVQVADPGPPQRVLPEIRVMDAGMTPRVPLRYRVAPGQTETLFLELVRGQSMQARGQGAQSGIPPVQLEVKMGPAEPTPQGFIRHPIQVTQVRLSKMAKKMSPAQREQMERTLAPLLQIQGWSEMDVQGRVRRGEFRGMEDVPPNLRTMLGNIRSALLTVPFPDQPLGARARWEVERRLQFSGVWVDQVVTYRIDKMDEKQLQLQITARQTAQPQAIGNGRLEAYQASIIGSAAVRLDYFTPYSEAESTSQMRISTQTQSGPELVRVDTVTAVRLYPAEAAQQMAGDEPEEEPADPKDANVITDPGKQRLKGR